MSAEGYRPTDEETIRAESSLSDEQKVNSETRESILIDPETKEQFAKYIETVRQGGNIPPNFASGPQSSYGIYSKPFEGYDSPYPLHHDIGLDKRTDSEKLLKWEKLLSTDAYERIADIFEFARDINMRDSGDYNEIYESAEIWINWSGSTLQAPTQADGGGKYHSWKEYDNCWMEVELGKTDMSKWDVESFRNTDLYYHKAPRDGGNTYSANIGIALKMTNEQREKYLQFLLSTYGISEDQIK